MIGTRARTAGLAESPLLSNGHGGFGKRFGETGRLKDRYRAPNRLRGWPAPASALAQSPFPVLATPASLAAAGFGTFVPGLPHPGRPS